MLERLLKGAFSYLATFAAALVLAGICRHFLFSPVTVYGESMSPTLANHEKVIVSKVGEIHRFDIIVFHALDEDAYYVKRVIGLPGDSLEIKNDTLYINGKPYAEPYLKQNKAHIEEGSKLTGDFTLKEITGKSTVPKDSFFVMGDNRRISKDSRMFKFISAKSVVGKVELSYYPLKDLGMPK